jgi:triosephosphate isomerase
MRKPIVAANWKMNKSIGDAIDLAAEVKRRLTDFDEADVVVCPPFTALKSVGDLLRYSNVKLGAQNMHWEPSGAHTGEISVAMLRDLGCDYVILGHSERRAQFHETDSEVNRKAHVALDSGLCPIVCVGETLEEREAERMEEVLRTQIESSLEGLGGRLPDLVIAYEPVWAIGTGKTATDEQAQEAHAFIRRLLAGIGDDDAASATRIQYGGSCKPSNASGLFRQPDVDGGLIGGASLSADSFTQIVRSATSETR